MKLKSPMKALLVIGLGLVFSLLNAGNQGLARSSECSPTLDEPCILVPEYSCHVWSVAFSPDGRFLAAGSMCGVTVWEVATGARLWFATLPFSAHSCSLAFNPEGTLLAERFGYYPGRVMITLREVETGTEVWSLDEDCDCDYTSPTKIAFSADGGVLAWGSGRHEVKLYEVATSEVDGIWTEYGGCFAGLAFSPNGHYLAGASDYGRIVFWDVQELVWQGYHGDCDYDYDEEYSFEEEDICPPWVLAFRPLPLTYATPVLVYGCSDGTIKLCDHAYSRPKAFGRHRDTIIDIAFSADGGVLASVSVDDPIVFLWNVANGELLEEIWPLDPSYSYSRPDHIKSLSFSPDGLLAVGYFDSTVVWDVSEVIAEVQEPIEIPDENLARVIRTQLAKSPEEPINRLDMLTLTSLDAASQGIINLDGIYYAANLQHLDLRNNELSDLNWLFCLTKLVHVNAANNNITDIYSGLCDNWGLGKGDSIDLTGNVLDVSPGSEDMNSIQSLIDRGVEVQFDSPIPPPVHIPDENLAKAIRNILGKPPEEQIYRSDLESMEELLVPLQEIRDLTGLQYAVNLRGLDLWSNEIADISVLAELPNLTWVDLEENPLDLSPGSKAMEVIQTLLDRGVDVQY